MSSRPILRSGPLELALLPAVGGSIARFDFVGPAGRQPLFRGTDHDDVGPLEVACFPLVPFANRIRGGRFAFRGREVLLKPNMAPDLSPLHGQGWQRPWELVAATERSAHLRYYHAASEWPWSYEAEQRLALDGGGLAITLDCRNFSDAPMPCALGLHPYHPCDSATVLESCVETVWTVDDDVLPIARTAAVGRYDLRQRPICGQRLDNGYGGWSGSAEIRWPGQQVSLRLASPDAKFFQIYSPAEGRFFAAEPVQQANAALNAPELEWPTLGMAVLEPGQGRRLRVRYDVIAST